MCFYNTFTFSFTSIYLKRQNSAHSFWSYNVVLNNFDFTCGNATPICAHYEGTLMEGIMNMFIGSNTLDALPLGINTDTQKNSLKYKYIYIYKPVTLCDSIIDLQLKVLLYLVIHLCILCMCVGLDFCCECLHFHFHNLFSYTTNVAITQFSPYTFTCLTDFNTFYLRRKLV